MRPILKSLRSIIPRSSSPRPSHFLRTGSERWHYRPGEDPAIARFFAETWSRVRNPIWPFINRLNRSRTRALFRTLIRQNISWVEYRRWSKLAGLHDPKSLSQLGESPISPSGSTQPPTWALIHLLTYRVHTSSQAQAVFEMVLARISTAPPDLIPSIFILCAHILANHQLLNSLKFVVSGFIRTPQQKPYFQYHLLLKAIFRFHPSLEISRIASMVLDHLFSQEDQIEMSTFRTLLGSPAMTATLARRIQEFMTSQSVAPTPIIKRKFFRIFARRGSTQRASQYSSFSQRIPIHQFVDKFNQSPAESISWLKSFRNAEVAFRYIDSVLKMEGPKTFSSLDICSLTSVFSLIAGGETVNSQDLLNLFSQIKKMSKPTNATYTVLIRGLLARENFEGATKIWDELLDSGIALDLKSLSAGVDLWTSSGEPLKAFRLIEKYAVKPADASNIKLRNHPHRRIPLSPAFINVFMEMLLRANRPDAVFSLWDYSEVMYGVIPDASTLNILLSTAMIAGKYEDTLSGLWARLRAEVSTTLHTETPSFGIVARADAVQSIESILSTRQGRLRRAPTGMWRNTPAWRQAARIFCHAVLGNTPALLKVSAPVKALRSSFDDVGRYPLIELVRNILGPTQEDLDDIDLDSPASLARLGLYPLGAYPGVVPTKITFHNYIYLLGLNNQASQIPLAMAWMRELGILPMKKTVAMVLVFWGEVSIQAPLVERWMGGGEYAKFSMWIGDWIGPDKMPSRSRMEKTTKIIAGVRGGYGSTYREHG